MARSVETQMNRSGSHQNNVNFCSVEILSETLSGICEGDPLSPPKGEAAQGGNPPWPPLFLAIFTHKIHYPFDAPRGEGRRDPERPWLYRNRILKSGKDFYRAKISKKN
jgi:hypothetical protein